MARSAILMWCLVLIGLIAAGCSDNMIGPGGDELDLSTTQLSKAETGRYDVSGSFYNLCTHERVYYTGYYRFTENKNGWHLGSSRLQGWNSSETLKYQIQKTVLEFETENEMNDAYTLLVKERWHVVSQTSEEPDMYQIALLRFHFNGNGDLISVDIDFDFECS